MKLPAAVRGRCFRVIGIGMIGIGIPRSPQCFPAGPRPAVRESALAAAVIVEVLVALLVPRGVVLVVAEPLGIALREALCVPLH